MSRRYIPQSKPVYVVRAKFHAWKRLFDVTLALLAMPMVLAIIVVCGALIWFEDRGPVIYRQRRLGKRGKPFRMLKLRTMVQNADQLKKELTHLNQLSWPDFKVARDPRITRVGRFLRSTSLDEFPQIVNVLLGDMSFVGPRPTSFDLTKYALRHTERLEVLPGITGLWQVSGRSDIDFNERVKLDVAYIENQSFAMDVNILMRTIPAVLGQRGAC